jgi:hypothetical protein
MRSPASPSTTTESSRCESLSQNGHVVRAYFQRVPQSPHESKRSRTFSVTAPIIWAMAGGDPHVGQDGRFHRSVRQNAKAATRGER